MIIYKVNSNDNTMSTSTKVFSHTLGGKINLVAGNYFTSEALLEHLDKSNIDILVLVGILSKIDVKEKIF